MTELTTFLPRPTRPGLAVAAMTVLVFAAALNTGANLLFLVGSLLVSVVLYAIVSNRRSFGALSAELVVPDLVAAATVVPVRLVVHGVRNIALVTADVFVPTAGLVLQPNRDSSCDVSFVAPTPDRGVVTSVAVVLTSYWPWHLVCRRARLLLDVVVDVHPRLPPSAHRRSQLRGRGADDSPRAGQDGSLRNIRAYVVGDSQRQVSWRVTARKGTLHVREEHDSARPTTRVELPSGLSGDALERRLEVLAGELRDALLHGGDVELNLAGQRDRLSGHVGLRRGLRALARYERGGAVDPHRSGVT